MFCKTLDFSHKICYTIFVGKSLKCETETITKGKFIMRKLSIKESMDSSIPSWLRGTLARLGKNGTDRYGNKKPSNFSTKVDIANATYTPLPVPRTGAEFNKINKDPNQVTVIRGVDPHGTPFLWIPGYVSDGATVSFDPDNKWAAKSMDRWAAKKIIPYITDYGYLNLGGPELDAKRRARANKPEDRYRNAQYVKTSHDLSDTYEYGRDDEGTYRKIYAQGPAMQTWHTRKGYDKSGYAITGLEKYRKMLADMGIDNYENIMDETLSVYEEFATMPRKIRDNSRLFELYTRIGYSFMQALERVDRAYKDYLSARRSAQKYGYDPDDDAWAKRNLRSIMEWVKQDVDRMRLLISIANGEQELNDTNERKLYH